MSYSLGSMIPPSLPSSNPSSPILHPFGKLSTELQDLIWTQLLPPPRVIELVRSESPRPRPSLSRAGVTYTPFPRLELSEQQKAVRIAYGMTELELCGSQGFWDAHVPNQSFYVKRGIWEVYTPNVKSYYSEWIKPGLPRCRDTGLHPDANLIVLLSTCKGSRSVAMRHYHLVTKIRQLLRPFYFSPARDVLLIPHSTILGMLVAENSARDLRDMSVRTLATSIQTPLDITPQSCRRKQMLIKRVAKKFGSLDTLLICPLGNRSTPQLPENQSTAESAAQTRFVSTVVALLTSDQEAVRAAVPTRIPIKLPLFKIPNILLPISSRNIYLDELEALSRWDRETLHSIVHYNGYYRGLSRTMAENVKIWLRENGFWVEDGEYLQAQASSRVERDEGLMTLTGALSQT